MPRLKKLTDYAYSPTNPASEDAIRAQIDDSIQEVYDDSAKTDDVVDLTTNQTIEGVKTFSVSPVVPTPTTDFQASTRKFVTDAIADAIIGILPEGSVTDDYLGSDVKVGSLALLNTVNKTNVVSSINELQAEIVGNFSGVNQALNPIVPDSVTLQAIEITVPTDNVKFTMDIQTTITGGPITIDKNGEGPLSLKNPDGTDVEELSQDTRFFDVIDDSTVFTLAPKGGASVKSIQRGISSLSSLSSLAVAISEVDSSKSILRIRANGYQNASNLGVATIKFNSNTSIQIQRGASSAGIMSVYWEVIEYENVKSKQTGSKLLVGSFPASNSVTISSVNTSKSIVAHSVRSTSSNNVALPYTEVGSMLTTSTNLELYNVGGYNVTTVEWQVIELN